MSEEYFPINEIKDMQNDFPEVVNEPLSKQGSPVIEIENDDVSTSTANNYKDNLNDENFEKIISEF